MCRRPLCRVCFACKAGCRCCPQKRDQEGQEGRGHKEAPLPCHPPGLASLCCRPPSTASLPRHLSLLHSLLPPSWVRCATPPSALPNIPLPPSQHTQFCVSWETSSSWCIEAGRFHADTHPYTTARWRIERAEKQYLNKGRERRREWRVKEWSPLIKWFFTALLCIFSLTCRHSGEIINKSVTCINIAFDSRQVAGWEQMLGGKTDRAWVKSGGKIIKMFSTTKKLEMTEVYRLSNPKDMPLVPRTFVKLWVSS